jgi:hypothetical protein
VRELTILVNLSFIAARNAGFCSIVVLTIGAAFHTQAGLITSVVESGGDGGSAVPAKFTGQTFTNSAGLGEVTVGFFGEDALAFSDRAHQWNSVTNHFGVPIGMPSYLTNGEYIVPGNDRRDNKFYSLTVAVSQSVYVYVLIDNRGSVTNGHANLPPDIGIGTNSLGLPFMNWVLSNGFAPVRTAKNRRGDLSIPDEVGWDEAASLGVGPGVSVDTYGSVYGKKTGGTFFLGEYAAGSGGRNMYGAVISTNPPTPVITAVSSDSPGQISLRFNAVPGATYRIEHNDNLSDAQWPQLNDDKMAGTNSITITDTPGSAQRFYRIRVLP